MFFENFSNCLNDSGAQGRFASRKPDYAHVLYQGSPDLCYSEYESRIIGLKSYEFTDHLGNPRVIFNDNRLENYTFNKLATPPNISHTGSLLALDPVEMNNYYPFGMIKEGMFAKTGEGYRYGFNGMERDNETKGYGNDLSTFFRGYDPRIARWKSVDPVVHHWESPYAAFANNPVLFVDPRGDVSDPNLKYGSGCRNCYIEHEGQTFTWHEDAGKWLHGVPGDDWYQVPEPTFLRGVFIDGPRLWLNDVLSGTIDRYHNFGLVEQDIENAGEAVWFSAKLYAGEPEAVATAVSTGVQLYEYTKTMDSHDWGVVVGYMLPEIAAALATRGINANVAAQFKNGTTIIKVTSEVAEEVIEEAIEQVVAKGIRFESFYEFKKVMGNAGDGLNWHHIVEQNPANLAKFGPEKIHNTNNIIKIPGGKGSLHAKISGYYSSKRKFTGGLTVRQWLRTKSFEEQYKFGIKILKKYGWEQ